MSNYYCVYCPDSRHRAECVEYLKQNARRNNLLYKLYPNLAAMPEVFQRAKFGAEMYGFFAVCLYTSDAAAFEPFTCFHPEYAEWTYLYTQDKDAQQYFGYVLRQAGMVAHAQKRARGDDWYDRPHYFSMMEETYYKRLDWLNRERAELDRLYAEHRDRVASWRKANSDAIRRARLDLDRLNKQISELAVPRAIRIYEEYKKAHPGHRDTATVHVYADILENEKRKIREDPAYKVPLANIERVLAGKPRKSAEFKERRAKFMRLDADFDTWPHP